MNIRFMAYLILARHAESASASFVSDNQLFERNTLKQAQGDALIMIDCGHSDCYFSNQSV